MQVKCPQQRLISFLSLLFVLFSFPTTLHAQLINEPQKAGWEKFKLEDYTAAHKIWLPLARQGDPDAALGIAILYENGLGTTKDPATSVKWYQLAADKGLPEAQHDLGIKYFTGNGVKKDPAKAYDLWKAAAESGLSAAQAKLAYQYTTGLGTKVNYTEAVRWYRQAVKQNNGEAMYNLSLLYQNGTGVRQDHNQFLHWLNQAAIYNHARAQYDLGLMLLHGMEVERSIAEGKQWLLKSAENGLVDAQYYLGTLYINGHILAPDRERAMVLIRAAANQGHDGAKQTLLDLKNMGDNKTAGVQIGKAPARSAASRKTARPPSSAAATQSNPIVLPSKSETIASSSTANAALPPLKTSHKTAWLLTQRSDRYTIQILATQDEAAATAYIQRNPALNAFIYSFVRSKKRWYVVAAGIFDTHQQAVSYIETLPPAIRKTKPWVRNIGIIKGIIDPAQRPAA